MGIAKLKSLELFERALKDNYNPIFNHNEKLTDDRKIELNKNLFSLHKSCS